MQILLYGLAARNFWVRPDLTEHTADTISVAGGKAVLGLKHASALTIVGAVGCCLGSFYVAIAVTKALSQNRWTPSNSVTPPEGDVNDWHLMVAANHILVAHEDASNAATLDPTAWRPSQAVALSRTRADALALAEALSLLPQRELEIVVNTFSDDVLTRSAQGSLWGLPRSNLELWPQVATAIDRLTRGDVSGVVESPFGFHVFWVSDNPLTTVAGRRIVVGHREATWLRHEQRDSSWQGRSLEEAWLRMEDLLREIEAGRMQFADVASQYSITLMQAWVAT